MTVGEFKQHLYELTEAGQIDEDTEIRLANSLNGHLNMQPGLV